MDLDSLVYTWQPGTVGHWGRVVCGEGGDTASSCLVVGCGGGGGGGEGGLLQIFYSELDAVLILVNCSRQPQLRAAYQ